MKEEIFVECKSISIGYRERSSASVVVKSDMTLRAFSGEIVALIGGNGIGKSTLLKTIAGFQTPLSGELLIHQRLAGDYGPKELAREMSFVSTEIVRAASLTVREMVGLGRFPYTNWFGQLTENDQAIIDTAIRQVGLSGYENRQISRISDGERQRAMIARALAQDTRIMILDEPTAFLDISNKYEIVRILHRLAEEQGKCVIFSTHDLNTALSIADHIWLMLDDRVVEGLPEEVAARGYFNSLFPNNPHLVFDPKKGDFRIRKENKGKVKLTAKGQEMLWATKALERIGFEVVQASRIQHSTLSSSAGVAIEEENSPVSSFAIEVTQVANGWSVSYSDRVIELETMEQLCRVMKKIMHQHVS